MKLKTIFLITIATLFFCYTPTIEASVKYTFVLTDPTGSQNTTFNDDNITMTFTFPDKPDFHEYTFKLTNKGTIPLKIDWSQVSIIGENGQTYRVGHNGVAYVDVYQGKQLPATIVPPGAFITDEIYTAEGLENWGSMGWVHNTPLYPRSYKDAVKTIGTTRKIFMPIDANGKVIYYTFAIKVDRVEDKR